MAVEVISWRFAPNVIACRFPETDFTTLSRLIVAESQEALVQIGGRFEGPFSAGTYTLNTENFPFLEKFVNAQFAGGKSPFQAEVYFVQKAYALDLKWGTPTAIQVRDPLYKIMIPVRAFGQYGMTIKNSRKFLTKFAGTLPAFTKSTLSEHFRGMLVMEVKTLIGQYIAQKSVSVLDIVAHQSELADAVSQKLAEVFDEFGVGLSRFAIASISTDEEDPAVIKLRDALAQRAEMDIVGYDYRQMRSFDTLQVAAGNEGAGGMSANLMGAGMGIALGAGLGTAMGAGATQIGNPMNFSASTLACVKCGAQNPTGTKYCSNCGNSLINEVSLSGNRCCPKCDAPIPAKSKFCPNCGNKLQTSCPKCGQDLPAGTKFCSECGEKIW